MDIEQLSIKIFNVHEQFYKKAVSAVNISLTLRNWFVGFYIVEYEQNGDDRAKYGDKLLKTLSKSLQSKKLDGMSFTNLNVYRKFYLVYPQIGKILPDLFKMGIIQTLPEQLDTRIIRTLSEQLQYTDNYILTSSLSEKLNPNNYLIPPEKTLTKLSFSHLEELIRIENPLKRAFYEIECIAGTWSTRELQRQINSLYYERSALSENKEKLSELANAKNLTKNIQNTKKL